MKGPGRRMPPFVPCLWESPELNLERLLGSFVRSSLFPPAFMTALFGPSRRSYSIVIQVEMLALQHVLHRWRPRL